MPTLTDEHRRLAALAGQWQGTTKTWFDPNREPHVARTRVLLRSVLGGLFLVQEHESSVRGEPFSGMVIYGFDVPRRKYVSTWIDSFHMGSEVMHSEGVESEGAISLLGSYTDHIRGQLWGWRSVIQMPGKERLVLEAYNISPEGRVDRALETRLARVKPARRSAGPRTARVSPGKRARRAAPGRRKR